METHDKQAEHELQARWEALSRQLALVCRIDPASTAIDLDELAVWLTDQLDDVEMQLFAMTFAPRPDAV